jgi:hypothetical protein
MDRTALKVVIVAGLQQGQEFFLSKRITRLGSDPGCDIQILGEGIDAHAVSIDADGEEIVVYNKSDCALTVTGQKIAPHLSGVWKQGKNLELPGAVHLRLEAYTAKAVAHSNKLEFEPTEEAAPSEIGKQSSKKPTIASQKKPGKNNTGPFIFIGLCVVAVIAMIIMKAGGDSPAPASSTGDAQALTWAQAWIELRDEKRLADPRFDALRTGLQHLYRLQKNVDSPDNARWKARVLQGLIAAESAKTQDQEFIKRLRMFVNGL